MFFFSRSEERDECRRNVLTGMIASFASAIGKESRKKICTTFIPPDSKPLHISDLSDDEFFYPTIMISKRVWHDLVCHD